APGLDADLGAALRDVAGGVVERPAPVPTQAGAGDRLGGLEDLVSALVTMPAAVSVREVAPDRYVAFLPGPHGGDAQQRLAVGDHTAYAEQAARAIADAVSADARVLLVGYGQGGAGAVEIATRTGAGFVVDQVVTVRAPAAHVPRVPSHVRVLSLEERADPVALLGSLVNADAANRVTVIFDGGDGLGPDVYVVGARAADTADHPAVRAELDRLRDLGYLSRRDVS
ncbi:MAG: hypothetical protein WBP61_13370, partial [Nocardioides sp.]